MDKETRQKALMYAAKAVVSVAFLTACSSNSESAETDPIEPSEDEIVKGSPACTAGMSKLHEVFPTGDKEFYDHFSPTDPAREALAGNTAVATCCESILKKQSSSLTTTGKFRSLGCCAADFSHSTDSQGTAIACTPWGPPVPPSMKWLREIEAEAEDTRLVA